MCYLKVRNLTLENSSRAQTELNVVYLHHPHPVLWLSKLTGMCYIKKLSGPQAVSLVCQMGHWQEVSGQEEIEVGVVILLVPVTPGYSVLSVSLYDRPQLPLSPPPPPAPSRGSGIIVLLPVFTSRSGCCTLPLRTALPFVGFPKL